ncbi:hypothetical protein EYZ11_013053 [Aspergillus tanneri]|uniref:Uncharacterized protein n=1 Tax=Aspergillus tanneri TaxID=1220188 RepID=A0A4S3IYN3_9EURO|nr:hypothetical protein EYZ11_013053 [Aspergillus tanneri]
MNGLSNLNGRAASDRVGLSWSQYNGRAYAVSNNLLELGSSANPTTAPTTSVNPAASPTGPKQLSKRPAFQTNTDGVKPSKKEIHMPWWQSYYPNYISFGRYIWTTPLSGYYGGNVRRAPRESLSTVGIPKDYPACNPYQFGAWFHLPSLRSLAIWLKTQQEFLIPGVLSNITQLNTLIIARSTIQEDQVPSLLSETGSLRTLHLGLEYYPPPFGDRFREIGEEELRKPFHRFLKHFPRLTSVEVPVELLIGWDPEPSVDLTMVLPSTLEQLCIREELVYLTPRDWRDYWTEKSLEDCLLENASRLQSHMPDLRQIRLRSWAPTERGNVRRVKQRLIVYTKFKQLGIQFDLVFDHMSTGLWI